MKIQARKALVLMIGIAIILIAGCAQQEQSSPKKDRTIVAENIALKKKVELRGKEIRELKKQHEEEMENKENALAKCVEEKEVLKKKSQQNVREQVKGVLDAVLEDNAKLREENAKLKAQIEELNTELQQDSVEQ
jgi:cytochrome c556